MKILEVKGLHVMRGDKKILEDVSFKLNRGEVLGIIGPNGGGKSTLIKAIAGLLPFDAGIIWIREGERLGYVPQFASFDDTFPITVKEVILSGSPYWSRKERLQKGAYQKVETLIERYQLSEVAEHPIGALSGGQTQRVLISRALMGNPSILMMDEPTASIDFQTKDQLVQELRKKEPDMTIILVSHDLNVVNRTVNSILCVNRNADFHPDNRLETEQLKKVYGCPIEVVLHGDIPHRILGTHHTHGKETEE